MAIAQTGSFTDYNVHPFHDSEVNLKFEDHAIQGKMIVASYTCGNSEMMGFSNVQKFQDFIKDKLAVELARAMITGKLVEFTLVEDLASNSTSYRARCFATSDDKVKVLRINKKNPQETWGKN